MSNSMKMNLLYEPSHVSSVDHAVKNALCSPVYLAANFVVTCKDFNRPASAS